jgi:hypothetical protein
LLMYVSAIRLRATKNEVVFLFVALSIRSCDVRFVSLVCPNRKSNSRQRKCP